MGEDDGETMFEVIEVGTTVDCGSTTVSEAEIIEFVQGFDPLSIHTDPAAASAGQFGGIITSGSPPPVSIAGRGDQEQACRRRRAGDRRRDLAAAGRTRGYALRTNGGPRYPPLGKRSQVGIVHEGLR